MIKRLIRTLFLERGELYVITNGRRVLLAHCEPEAHIYECSQNIKSVGMRTYGVKTCHMAIVLCSDMDFTREADEDFLKTVTRFELSSDIQRSDGVFEKITVENLAPDELDLNGKWTFEVIGQQELIRKLIEY